MSQSFEHNGFESNVAEFEETMPLSPTLPPPQAPLQGSTIPPTDPLTSAAPASVAAPIPVDQASPVLTHIVSITTQAEETLQTITHDMDMSTLSFVAHISLGKSPQSLLDLQLLNTQFEHVVTFATSTTVLGYLDGVDTERLEAACNSTSHLHKSMVAVAIKARLFAKCKKRRVKGMKDEMVRILVGLEDWVQKFVRTMEEHLGRQLPGWIEMLEVVRFARAAWEEVVA